VLAAYASSFSPPSRFSCAEALPGRLHRTARKPGFFSITSAFRRSAPTTSAWADASAPHASQRDDGRRTSLRLRDQLRRGLPQHLNGDIAAIGRTSIGVTHGLFGPTLKPAKGSFCPFATLKVGFVDFRLSPTLLPLSTVTSTILGIRTSSLNAAIYPGGGVEASLGPLELRSELGDEIYFNNGAHNNLRITFGPIVRF
jgi:hypothetical protein